MLKRSLRFIFGELDGPLLTVALLLLAAGLVVLYSATMDAPARLNGQLRNIAAALLVMWVAAHIPPQTLMRIAVPVYLIGTALLVARGGSLTSAFTGLGNATGLNSAQGGEAQALQAAAKAAADDLVSWLDANAGAITENVKDSAKAK